MGDIPSMDLRSILRPRSTETVPLYSGAVCSISESSSTFSESATPDKLPDLESPMAVDGARAILKKRLIESNKKQRAAEKSPMDLRTFRMRPSVKQAIIHGACVIPMLDLPQTLPRQDVLLTSRLALQEERSGMADWTYRESGLFISRSDRSADLDDYRRPALIEPLQTDMWFTRSQYTSFPGEAPKKLLNQLLGGGEVDLAMLHFMDRLGPALFVQAELQSEVEEQISEGFTRLDAAIIVMKRKYEMLTLLRLFTIELCEGMDIPKLADFESVEWSSWKLQVNNNNPTATKIIVSGKSTSALYEFPVVALRKTSLARHMMPFSGATPFPMRPDAPQVRKPRTEEETKVQRYWVLLEFIGGKRIGLVFCDVVVAQRFRAAFENLQVALRKLQPMTQSAAAKRWFGLCLPCLGGEADVCRPFWGEGGKELGAFLPTTNKPFMFESDGGDEEIGDVPELEGVPHPWRKYLFDTKMGRKGGRGLRQVDPFLHQFLVMGIEALWSYSKTATAVADALNVLFFPSVDKEDISCGESLDFADPGLTLSISRGVWILNNCKKKINI